MKLSFSTLGDHSIVPSFTSLNIIIIALKYMLTNITYSILTLLHPRDTLHFFFRFFHIKFVGALTITNVKSCRSSKDCWQAIRDDLEMMANKHDALADETNTLFETIQTYLTEARGFRKTVRYFYLFFYFVFIIFQLVANGDKVTKELRAAERKETTVYPALFFFSFFNLTNSARPTKTMKS